MPEAPKYNREFRPTTYWAEDEEPVLQLMAAIADAKVQKRARALFREQRFDDLEELLIERNVLLDDGRINKKLKPLKHIHADTLDELETEPVWLAGVDSFGTSNVIEAVRVGWTIHHRYRIDTAVEEELGQDDLPLTLGEVADHCTSIASSLRNHFAEEYPVDELEGMWSCSGDETLYPGINELFYEDEQEWLVEVRSDRGDDDEEDEYDEEESEGSGEA